MEFIKIVEILAAQEEVELFKLRVRGGGEVLEIGAIAPLACGLVDTDLKLSLIKTTGEQIPLAG